MQPHEGWEGRELTVLQNVQWLNECYQQGMLNSEVQSEQESTYVEMNMIDTHTA